MNQRLALVFSALFHLIFFLTINKQNPAYTMQFNSGSTIASRFNFRLTGSTLYQTAPETGNSTDEGKISKEILKLKNKISYPAIALEQKLESECEWEITTGNNHIARDIQETRKCRFPIFSAHVKKLLVSWEFDLPAETRIRIPVSFKLSYK